MSSSRSSRCLYDAGTALRRVFFQPRAAQQPARLAALPSFVFCPRGQPQQRLQPQRQQQQSRPFSSDRRRGSGPKLAQGRLPRDEEIRHRYVQVRDDATGKLSPPMLTASVLAELDRRQHSLVVLAMPGRQGRPSGAAARSKDGEEKEEGEEEGGGGGGGGGARGGGGGASQYPICRIVDRKAELAAEQQKVREVRRKVVQTKELELNWAIAAHDLQHRLRQLRTFLSKGMKVEIMLLNKSQKRGKKKVASRDEAEETMRLVKEAAAEVPGAKEMRPSEGKMLGTLRIFVEGPVGGVPAADAERDDTQEAAA